MAVRILFLPLCATLLTGCERNSAAPTAPEPQILHGMTRDRTQYTFLKWDEGLSIMLVDWCDSHSMSGSSGSGKADQRNGDARWWDRVSDQWKVGYEWHLETTDGQSATFTINNVEYDLAKGAVFRIDTGEREAAVTQVDEDVSKIPPDRNACEQFVTSTSELKKATEGTHSENE